MKDSVVAFGSLPAPKHPDSSVVVELDFFYWLARFWEPGRERSLTEHVRPTVFNGYAYECTTAGQSGDREPAWSTSGTVTDGSVVWTPRSAGTHGLIGVASSPVLAVTPSGELTAGSESVVRNTAVRLTLAAGDAGNRYRVECRIQAGGQTLVGSLYVPVAVK